MGPGSTTEILVRHAMAVADPAVDPARWELGPAGRAAAADLALRARLGRVHAIVSSPEPKARATADAVAAQVGVDVEVDDRLVEARRPWVGEGYRKLAHRYLAGADVDGWEPRAEVAARVEAAVAERRAAGAADAVGDIVVVGHGLGLSLHLGAVLPAGFDLYGFWCRLAFPDAWRLDREALTLERVPRAP